MNYILPKRLLDKLASILLNANIKNKTKRKKDDIYELPNTTTTTTTMAISEPLLNAKVHKKTIIDDDIFADVGKYIPYGSLEENTEITEIKTKMNKKDDDNDGAAKTEKSDILNINESNITVKGIFNDINITKSIFEKQDNININTNKIIPIVPSGNNSKIGYKPSFSHEEAMSSSSTSTNTNGLSSASFLSKMTQKGTTNNNNNSNTSNQEKSKLSIISSVVMKPNKLSNSSQSHKVIHRDILGMTDGQTNKGNEKKQPLKGDFLSQKGSNTTYNIEVDDVS